LKLVKTDFLKNAGTLFSGSLIAQAIAFGAMIFLGRLYSPVQFGEFEVIFKLSAVIIAIAGLRYELAIVVEENTTHAQEITRLTLLINAGISICLVLCVALFKNQIAGLLKLDNVNILYVVPFIVWLSSSTETIIGWRNRNKEYATISTNRVVASSSSVIYKLSHPYLSITGWNGLLAGHILGQVISLVQISRKLPFRLFKTTRQKLITVFKKYKSLALLSSPAALINILATSMPTFFITIYDSTEATGHFANAYKLTYLPLGMIAAALGQVFFERISRTKNNQEETAQMAHQLFNLMFAIAIIPIVILVVWGDNIAPFILGAQWTEAGEYIQITILFYFSMYLTTSFSSALVIYNKLNVQLVYNIIFLVGTFSALYFGYTVGGDTKHALAWFAVVGVVLRLIIINYFFYLFGKNLIAKTIFAILITTLLVWIGFGIKEGF
jgi:O-antigen/teichoic acid export membrane protein